MNISVLGAESSLHAAAKKKIIKEKYILSILNDEIIISSSDLKIAIKDLNELLQFYNRLITSITKNIKMTEKKKDINQTDYSLKKQNLMSMKKEFAQARKERTTFKQYLISLKSKLLIELDK